MNEKVNNWTLDNFDQDKIIWRFMDFTKFADLVLSRKLYCCRLDSFEDNYEGYISELDIQGINGIYKSLQDTHGISFDHSSLAGSHVNRVANLKHASYASCWHMNEYESAAMWRLYAQTNEAIAIKTTLRKLDSSLSNVIKQQEQDQIYISNIKYLDYDKPETYPDNRSSNWLSPLFTKRYSFEHEKEVRVLYLNMSVAFSGGECAAGVSLDVDTNTLIEVVYVSPNAPDWFFELTKTFLIKVGLGHVVCMRSELYRLK